MKSNLIVAWAVSCAFLAACQFDRTPLMGKTNANAGRDASMAAPDARAVEPEEASVAPDPDAASGTDAGTVVGEGGVVVMDAGGSVVPPDHDDGGKPAEPPENPPMTGGLACGGTFCAYGINPEKPCCTTAADVTQRTARAADLCGLKLDALPGNYGDHCWQRDQLGILDERCPDLPAANGGTSEPGCCSDNGQCGSINADHKLGCRYESGSAPRACAEQPSNTCDAVGNFGIRISVDAAWGGRSGGLWELTDDGRGKIDVILLIKVSGVDATTHRLDGTAHVCGVTLPPFLSSTLCEAYQPIFPTSIWASDTLRKLPLLGRYECAANGGCAFSLDPQTYLLGFDMNNSEAPWPAAGTTNQLRCPAGNGMKCFLDHDDDGNPGVRVELKSGGYLMGGTGCRNRYEYRGAPLSSSAAAIFDGVRRTDRLELGIRTKLGGTVRLNDDCDSARGSALAEYVNSRAAGCWVEQGTYNFGTGMAAGPNERCVQRETNFMDENLPVYMLLAAGQIPDSDLKIADKSASKGPEVSVVRLKPGAMTACQDARSAKY
ncbi:MAG TPA: hypothetical protein VJV78_00145 [Polyangiales bacterium]|nr:hypothetical protein [Polyangiales bacterium]